MGGCGRRKVREKRKMEKKKSAMRRVRGNLRLERVSESESGRPSPSSSWLQLRQCLFMALFVCRVGSIQPLSFAVLLLPNTVLSCGVLQLHHSGVGDPFYNYNTTHHVTNFDSTLHCCYSLKNYSAMIGSLNIFVC